jgi:hypothetical protein
MGKPNPNPTLRTRNFLLLFLFSSRSGRERERRKRERAGVLNSGQNMRVKQRTLSMHFISVFTQGGRRNFSFVPEEKKKSEERERSESLRACHSSEHRERWL